jgi:hypothetical protein
MSARRPLPAHGLFIDATLAGARIYDWLDDILLRR